MYIHEYISQLMRCTCMITCKTLLEIPGVKQILQSAGCIYFISYKNWKVTDKNLKPATKMPKQMSVNLAKVDESALVCCSDFAHGLAWTSPH